MRAFRYDVERVKMTPEEEHVFAAVVIELCHQDRRLALSQWLSQNEREQPLHVQDFAQRQARAMWRTEARL